MKPPSERAGKRIAAALVVAPSLLFSLPGYADAPDFDLYVKLASTVLKIEAQNPDGSTSLGSGVMIAPGRLVTNCHVTRNATRITVIKSGLRWDAVKQQSDVEHDLCLLYVAAQAAPVAKLENGKLKVGQAVYAVGYINGLGPRMSGGKIRALYNYDGGKVIQSTSPFGFGASGGGLFDEHGRLVGVVSFNSRLDANYHFSLPISWVTDRLAINSSQDVGPLPGETAFWQLPYEREPFFLRAAALEARHDWSEMLALAENWTKAQSSNSNSWFALGKAQQHLQQYDEAIAAYRKAIMLDHDYPEAWYNLGLVYLELGQHGEVDKVDEVLRAMDQELAQELSKAQTSH